MNLLSYQAECEPFGKKEIFCSGVDNTAWMKDIFKVLCNSERSEIILFIKAESVSFSPHHNVEV